MPIIDFTGSAYRDASRGMTLKALQERLKAAETGTLSAAKPEQIADPWQGAAHVMGVIGAGLRESRAASAEQAGREAMAKILAGGVTPDEYGQLYMSDPELAGKYMEHDWQAERDKAQQAFDLEKQKAGWGHDEALQKAGWGHDEALAAARVQAEKDAADARAKVEAENAERTAALGPEEAQLNAALKAGTINQEQHDTGIKLLRDKQTADIAKGQPSSYRPVTPDDAARWGGDIQKNPQNYQIETRSGQPSLINPSQFTPAEQEKRTYESKSKLNAIDGGLDELNRALEIAPDVTQWGEAGRTVYSLLPEKLQPEEYAKTANATKRFDQITQSNAIKRMAAELSGTDSDKDVQRFISIMADPNASLELKKQTLSSMINTLQRERALQRDRLKGITGEDAGDYKYTNPDVLPGDTAPAGGGGGGEPQKPADWSDAEWNVLTPEEKAQFR